MSRPTDRWGCAECDWSGTADAILEAPSPFDPDQVLCGCPECRTVGSLERLCDAPGCKNGASMGLPTATGYVTVCWDHREWVRQP